MTMRAGFYEQIAPGRFRSSAATAGPWSPDAQHGGPPSALLTRAMMAAAGEAGDTLQLGRITCELLRPVPIADLDVEARVVRPGRNVVLVDGQMTCAGEPLMLARAWLLRPAPALTAGAVLDPGSIHEQVDPPGGFAAVATEGPHWAHTAGYLSAVEWRTTQGGFNELGAGGVWARPHRDLVAGAPTTPVELAVMIADSGSGIGLAHDQREVMAINVDLTVAFDREPVGDWIHLASHTTGAEGGVSFSSSVLSDASGRRFARADQTLLVRAHVR